MMKKLLILIIAVVVFAMGYWTAVIKISVDKKFDIATEAIEASNQTTKEQFDDFIYKFIADSLFQMGRIKFPLRSMTANSKNYSTIKKENWKIVRLYGNEEYRAQLYDNFKGKLRDTDERLFCWEGVENGINVQYKFKRIDGHWYLIEYNDFSD